MFDRAIIDTDKFMDLAMSAKALYFLLGMEADDEGFVSYKKVLRIHGGNEDDVKLLVHKRFLIGFPSGVVVITDWNTNNYLDKNRIKTSTYNKEKSALTLVQVGKNRKSGDQKYVLTTELNNELNIGLTDVKPVEYRIVENSINEVSEETQNFPLLVNNSNLPITLTKTKQTPTEFEEYTVVPVNADGDAISPRKKPQNWAVEKRVFESFTKMAVQEYNLPMPEPAKLWQLKLVRSVITSYSKQDILNIFNDWFNDAPETIILNIHSALSAQNLNKYKMKK